MMTAAKQAEFDLLKLANERGKFAIDLAYLFPSEAASNAFERLMLRGWIRLIDVAPLEQHPKRLFRIFLASPEAMAWFRSHQ